MSTLTKLKETAPIWTSVIISLFFILFLHFKASYSALAILMSVIGLVLVAAQLKQRIWQLDKETQWLIGIFAFYFALFVLSLIVHKGRGSELDIPSRALLALLALAMCTQLKPNPQWIMRALVIAAIIAGLVALYQFFILQLPSLFPVHMYIQAGGVVMLFGLFCLALFFYFQQQKQKIWMLSSLIASGLTILACLLNQARGAWIALPVGLVAILWLNRQSLSKWVLIFLAMATLVGGLVAGNVIEKRWNQANKEITAYFDKNNGRTSLGARFDMWKSALIGMEEKPIFGWGLQGVKEMRKEHAKKKQISKYASRFDHAHNQYLQDGSARGIFGLLALLGIFFVPLTLFWRNLKHNQETQLWGALGILQVTSVMLYCLSQSFLSHNSGAIFYFFGVIIFYALQKNAKNRPLVAAK